MSVERHGKAKISELSDPAQRGTYLGYLTVSVSAKGVLGTEMAVKVERLQAEIAGLAAGMNLDGVITVHPLEEC